MGKVLKMKNIAFDLDGVLCDSYPAFRKDFWIKYAYDIYLEQNRYEIVIPNALKNIIIKNIRDILVKYNDYIYPYPETYETLLSIYVETMKPITIITAREKDFLANTTKKWCQDNLRIPFELHFCDAHKKKYLLKSFDQKIDYWVDDRLAIANDMSSIMDIVFLMNRRWNIERGVKKNVVRIDTLDEILPWIMEADG